MNNVEISGTICKNSLKILGANKNVCVFSIVWKVKTQQGKLENNFVNVRGLGSRKVELLEGISEGDYVFVKGKITNNTFNKKTEVMIDMDYIEKMNETTTEDIKEKEEVATSPTPAPQAKGKPTHPMQAQVKPKPELETMYGLDISDDDLPF